MYIGFRNIIPTIEKTMGNDMEATNLCQGFRPLNGFRVYGLE